MIRIIKFSKKKFNFKKIVNDYFFKKFKLASKNLHKIENLQFSSFNDISHIKKSIYKLDKNYFDVLKDQDLTLIKEFYKIDNYFQLKGNSKRGEFNNLYLNLVKYLEKYYFKEKIYFQKKPTLRLHLPNAISIGGYHRDSDYGHPKESINFWMPFVDTKKTNTLWLETKIKNKFKPKILKWGDILMFDSSIKHGVEINKENFTRASMDFRIIPKRNYKVSKNSSPKNKIKFILGEYYDHTNS
jgi:hypothetical protein